MSDRKRAYQVEYKLTFTGVVGDYEVAENDGVIELGKNFDQVKSDIIRDLSQLDYSEGGLLYSCDRCGEYIDVFDGGKARFVCDCTTETKHRSS